VSLGIFPYGAVYEALRDDLGVIGVIVGTGILVDVTSRSGLFQFIGIRIVKATRGDRARLFLYLNLLTFLFVSFLTIVPSMLIIVSLTLVACRVLEYDPKPFIISEAIVANSGALTTYASSLPNLIIGTAAGIPYVQFLMVSAPFALISLVLAHVLLRTLFRDSLKPPASQVKLREMQERVERFDEWSVVRDVRFFRRSGIILLATILGFAFARQLGVGLDFVALSGATAALLLSGIDTEEAIRQVNWSIVLFFAGLFTLIAAVEASGLLEVTAIGLSSITGGDPLKTQVLFLWFSAGASGIVDNIPVSATLIPMVSTLGLAGMATAPLWWSVIIGANIGGSSTPVGSISCVIALHSLEAETEGGVPWLEFMKIGGTVMLVQLVAATAYLLLLSWFDLIPAIPG
jgi:Na+/H+ antiporter NhaD/arsenite permease-like protein